MQHVSLLACVVLFAAHGRAAEPTGFIERTWEDASGEYKYSIFVPHSYKSGTHPPVILFLHGVGETGSDGKRPTEAGLGPAICRREKDFPFLVVFPQAQSNALIPIYTWYPYRDDGKRAVAIFDAVTKEFSTDPQRQYLTGVSMGGYGVWAWAATEPKRWAAIAPICGGGDSAWAPPLKDIPIWCFHGAADRQVPARTSRVMIEAIRAAGGKPKYDEFPGVDHNSWDKAYANDELYRWLLNQSKKD
ncbi:MAG: alpha/beta hydrolase-fold protein [Gemmataceae bacterium]